MFFLCPWPRYLSETRDIKNSNASIDVFPFCAATFDKILGYAKNTTIQDYS
jgi:hypothetical protein